MKPKCQTSTRDWVKSTPNFSRQLKMQAWCLLNKLWRHSANTSTSLCSWMQSLRNTSMNLKTCPSSKDCWTKTVARSWRTSKAWLSQISELITISKTALDLEHQAESTPSSGTRSLLTLSKFISASLKRNLCKWSSKFLSTLDQLRQKTAPSIWSEAATNEGTSTWRSATDTTRSSLRWTRRRKWSSLTLTTRCAQSTASFMW